MSMATAVCRYCNDGEAEALYALDDKIEWYCSGCNTQWSEEPLYYHTYYSQEELAKVFTYGED